MGGVGAKIVAVGDASAAVIGWCALCHDWALFPHLDDHTPEQLERVEQAERVEQLEQARK